MVGALLIAVAIVGAVIAQGLRRIPADPPYAALVTFLGKPIDRIKKPGWRLFIGYPHLFGFIPVNVTRRNQDFLILVRTPDPDNVELQVKVGITFQPDDTDSHSLWNYVRTEQADGIINILRDIAEEELRQWAASTVRGPKNWQEAISAGDEVTDIVIDRIIESEPGHIDNMPFPPSVLIKYFKKQQPSLLEVEKYGEDWSKIKEHLDSLPEEDRKSIEANLLHRSEEISKIKEANGFFQKKSLGIIVNRLNVGEIRPTNEKLMQAAEQKAEEERQRAAEETETDHVITQIKKLKKKGGLTKEQAVEIFQTERGKASKTIDEKKLSVSPETREVISNALSMLSFFSPKKEEEPKKKSCGAKKGGGKR